MKGLLEVLLRSFGQALNPYVVFGNACGVIVQLTCHICAINFA